jgi:NAD(P)-dependent dehydrogenase (short-subunit alcohol dehydrogenase family)
MANDQSTSGAKRPSPPFPKQQQEPPGLERDLRPRPQYADKPHSGLGRLKGKIALVTGGDSGIGRAVAVSFAREGADVAIAYLDEEQDAAETRAAIEEAGRQALLLPGDISSDAHCREIVERTAKQFGRIDVLVNNAAQQLESVERFEELSAERVERTFQVNIIAMYHMVRHALAHMKAGASIINVASIQAYQPSPQILDYAATKGAIVTFTKGLALELIERGIRVNCVAPGPVWTPLIAQSFPPDKVAKFGADSPMKRPAQPAELAGAFVFLASEEASYVNGEVLGVTGGKPLG